MTITVVLDPPRPGDSPAVFAAKAASLAAKLPTLVEQINAETQEVIPAIVETVAGAAQNAIDVEIPARLATIDTQVAETAAGQAKLGANRAEAAAELVQAALSASLAILQQQLDSTDAPTAASALIGSEPEGLAIDATTDDLSSAVKVIDLATPTNNFSGALLDFLAASCFPGAKMVTRQDGTMGWSDHNLLPYSEAFDGAGYIRTGLTASAKDADNLTTLTASAASASLYAVISSFVAGRYHVVSFVARAGTASHAYIRFEASTSLYAWFDLAAGAVGSVDAGLSASIFTTDEDGNPLPAGEYRCVVSRAMPAGTASPKAHFGMADANGSTTVTVGRTAKLRRASASYGVRTLRYLKTTGAVRYGIPYDWSQGGRRVLVEEVLTRFRSKWSDDLTNAAWVCNNCTPALDAIGPHGEPCSTLTATAADATCWQTYTSGATTNTFQARLRRKTGTGSVFMTMDGGLTWTDVTDRLSSSFAVAYTHRSGSSAITFGFKLASAGDAIEVALAVVGENAFLTSPVPTTDPGASWVQRAADAFRVPFTRFHAGSGFTAYFDFEYGEDPVTAEAACGVRGATDLHYIGLSGTTLCQRISTVGGTTYRNYLADAPADRRIEGALRVKANDLAASANGFGECYDNRPGLGTLDNLFVGNGVAQVFLRRLLVVPRAMADDALARWRYSGNRADARYLDDKKVIKFGEIAGTHICREPSVEVLRDNDAEATISVAFMQRNATNNTGHAELPARLMRAEFKFNKVTGRLTRTMDPAVLHQQANWESGLGHLQGAVLAKIRYGSLKGRLLCVFAQLDSAAGTLTPDWRRLYCKYSDDNGATWSAPTVIYDPGAGNAAVTAAADYVEVTSGPYAGRIAVPFYTGSGCGVIYTDDKGATWTVGTVVNVGSEPTVALRPDGQTLVMTIRQDVAPWRTYATSANGGATWSASADVPGLGGTRVCMSAIQNDPEGQEGTAGELLLIGARNTSPTYLYRSNLVVEKLAGTTLTPSGVQFAPLGMRRATGYVSAKRIGGGFLAIGYESTPTADPNNICEIRLMVVRWPQ